MGSYHYYNPDVNLCSADIKPEPEVSVIVPLHRDGPQFRSCLEAYRRMRSPVPFEVVVVSDAHVAGLPADIVYVTTGATSDTSPAVKRDLGAKAARGRLLGYIDDDAYPGEDWLDVVVKALSDPEVDAVGGPGLTPPGSPWRERLGGAVYESRLGSGPLRHRFLPVPPSRDADDLPAFNFAVRREAIEAVGGWNSTFYGGEDTKVCLELLKDGRRLRYLPTMVVYHHRRPVFGSHLRQVANVARHRGFFARRHPSTSRRVIYFLPAIGTAGAVPGALALAVAFARSPRKTAIFCVSAWLVTAAPAYKRAGPSAVVFPAALALHHLVYGIHFLRGLTGDEITN